MSDRRNMSKYMGPMGKPRIGGGGQAISRPGAYGTTGGIQLNPDTNEYQFSPLTMPKGRGILDAIFNGGQQAAGNAAMNNQIMMYLMQQQQQQKNAMALQQEKGKEDIDKSLADHYHMAPEDARALSPKAKAVLSNQMDAELGRQTGQVQPNLSPDYQRIQNMSKNAADLAPVFENFNKQHIQLPADTSVLYNPDQFSVNPYGQDTTGGRPAMATGPTVNQGVQQVPQTIDLGGGKTFTTMKDFPVRQVSPGSSGFPTGLTRNDLQQRMLGGAGAGVSPVSTFTNQGMGMQPPTTPTPTPVKPNSGVSPNPSTGSIYDPNSNNDILGYIFGKGGLLDRLSNSNILPPSAGPQVMSGY